MRDKTKTPAENLWGTYQTTFRTETWIRGRKTPRVQYTTTFAGKIEEHNSILELVRELHAEKDGQASALVEVFEKARKWTKLKEKDPDATIILSEVFNEAIEELNFLRDNLEDIKKVLDDWDHYDYPSSMQEIQEILGKDFEPSGDNIISRHRAAKDWIQRYKPSRGSFHRLNQQPFIELEKILEMDPSSIPTHCSKCGDELKPIHMNLGLVRGGWYTAPGSKDPLCPTCAEEVEG